MPPLTALQASINTILQIDTAYALSEGIGRDRILTGSSLAPMATVLSFGQGPGEANTVYCERLTFPSGNTDLDLLSLPTSRAPLGNRAFSSIRYARIRVASPATGSYLLIGNYGPNGWIGPLESNDSPYKIASKWEDVNEIDGWPVDTSRRYFRVNAIGEASIVADLLLIGAALVLPPLDLLITPGVQSTRLTWGEVESASSYNVYAGMASGTETLFATDIVTNDFEADDLDDGTTYYWKVSAIVNGSESGLSAEVSGTTAPGAPTHLASSGGVGGAYVQWDVMPAASTYDLQYSDDNVIWHNLSLMQSAIFYADSTGHSHYRVRATGLAGSSAYANATSGSPLPNVLAWLRSVIGMGSMPGVWPDQSGSNNGPAQATSGHQLSVAANVLGGKSVVRSSDIARFMSFSNILPVNADFAIGVLFKLSDQSDLNVIISGDSTVANAFFISLSFIPNSPLFGLWTGVGGLTADLTSAIGQGNPQTEWCFLLFTMIKNRAPNSGGPVYNAAWHINGQCGGISPTFLGIHPASATLNIGGPAPAGANHGGVGDYAEFLVTSSAPTAAAVNAMYHMANATYGLALTPFTKQVLFVGDSITAGGKATTSGGSWASLIAGANRSNYYINTGEPSAFASDVLADAPTRFYPYSSCGVPTTCTIMLGTNDIANSHSAASIYANIRDIALGLKANGASRVVIVTILPFSSGTEAIRQSACDLLVANADGAFDAIADVRGITMGTAGNNTDTTYYNADQVHPNDAGHAALYALINPLI